MGTNNDGKLINFSQVWIGATDLKDSGEFEYYDGEPIKFSIPWAKNQHDNKKTKKQGSKILFYLVKIYSITHLELNYASLSLTDMNIKLYRPRCAGLSRMCGLHVNHR